MKHLASLLVITLLLLSLARCTNSPSSSTDDSGDGGTRCTEPANPYEEGTGHYKGYEWEEENGGSCDTASDSFNEGCEEYQRQEAEYEDCQQKQ